MATNAIRGYVRSPSTGAGVNAVTVTAKLENGGTTVTSDATDANGLFEMPRDTVGYPGPVYLTFTSGGTTDRVSGNVWGQLGGLIWAADINDVLGSLGIGVAGTGLAVSGDGATLNVTVSAGLAILKDGCPYVLEAPAPVPLDAADPTNGRIDRVILRLTREGQTDQGKIQLTKITGTPAGSPAAPSLTQSAATWDFSLAQVLVDATVTAIAPGKVTDERYSASLAQAYSFVNPLTTAGDLPYLGSTGRWARLGIGSSGQGLLVSGGVPAWGTVYAAGGTDVPVADGGTGASTAADARTNLGVAIGTDVQAFDSGLAALAAFNTNGLVTQTANNTFAGRTLTGTSDHIDVTNGDGVSGNPTLDLAANHLGKYLVISKTAQTGADNTAGTSYAVVMDEDITLPTGTWTIHVLGGFVATNDGSSAITCKIVIDGTSGAEIGPQDADPTERRFYVAASSKASVSAGSRTISIQFKGASGTSTGRQPWLDILAIRTS